MVVCGGPRPRALWSGMGNIIQVPTPSSAVVWNPESISTMSLNNMEFGNTRWHSICRIRHDEQSADRLCVHSRMRRDILWAWGSSHAHSVGQQLSAKKQRQCARHGHRISQYQGCPQIIECRDVDVLRMSVSAGVLCLVDPVAMCCPLWTPCMAMGS